MKKNLWTYFNNGLGAFCFIFGTITMSTTFKLYDNYNLAARDYKVYESYNQLETAEKELAKPSFSKFLSYKYNFSEKTKSENPNIESISVEKIEQFKTFEEFRTFLKNKNTSFIYSKSAIDDINNNIVSPNFLEAKKPLEDLIQSYKKDENKKDKKMQDFISKLKIYNETNLISSNYFYNKTPENISMIFGIIILVAGFLTIFSYWSFVMIKQHREIKKM